MTTTTGNIANSSGGWSMPKNKMLESEDDLFNSETGKLETPLNSQEIEHDDREPASKTPIQKPIKGSKNVKKLIVGHRQRFLEGLEDFIFKHLKESVVFSDERRKNIEQLAREVAKELGHEYSFEDIQKEIKDALDHGDKDPEKLLDIIQHYIGKRWPEAEEFIKKNSKTAYWYAKRIIRARWPDAEEYIKKDPKWALKYAKNIIRGRWPEAEEYIKQDPDSAINYAIEILGQRWPEAEEYIKRDPYKMRSYLTMLHID